MKSLFNIMSDVEEQLSHLDRARAVIHAATEEIEDYYTYKHFRDEHAILLLHVADNILFDIVPALEQVRDILLDKHREDAGL